MTKYIVHHGTGTILLASECVTTEIAGDHDDETLLAIAASPDPYSRIVCYHCRTNLHLHLREGFVVVRFGHSRADVEIDNGYARWECPSCGCDNERSV